MSPQALARAAVPAWLAAASHGGTHRREALALFDALEPVPLSRLVGRWRGLGVPTGHPLDGLLEACGWYGKAFDDTERAFPLLFGRAGEARIAPARLPLRLTAPLWRQGRRLTPWAFRALRPLLTTSGPTARLRLLHFRGKLGAAMIYDAQPIIDVFRQVDADTLLGLMDCRYFDVPLFFSLHRA